MNIALGIIFALLAIASAWGTEVGVWNINRGPSRRIPLQWSILIFIVGMIVMCLSTVAALHFFGALPRK